MRSASPTDPATLETLTAAIIHGALVHHAQVCETLGLPANAKALSSLKVQERVWEMQINAKNDESHYQAHETPLHDDERPLRRDGSDGDPGGA